VFDSFGKLPIWQRILLFVFVAAAIVGAWYFFFYLDAVEARSNAENGLAAANKELAAIKEKRDNFDLEKAKVEAAEKELQAQREVLPLNSSTVDNLMQTFQQQSRLVGMTVEGWNNEPEEPQDFYASMPIRVTATGTWMQVGEFFRRVSELKRIVSIDKLSIKLASTAGTKADELAAEHPGLEVEFQAATYRFLTDEERKSADEKPGAKKGTRRKK
jgi:type IV pilus assembly protein PilO